MFKYSINGFYFLRFWYQKIHCQNCHYEGRAGIDWWFLAWVLLGGVFLFIINIFIPGDLVIPLGRWRLISNPTGSLKFFYLLIFLQSRYFMCPECKMNEGMAYNSWKKLHPRGMKDVYDPRLD